MEPGIYQVATQLLSRLYGALDERDYMSVARCFHPDGQWHRQGKLLRGRDAIVAELQQRSTSHIVHHLYSNCLFDCVGTSRLKVRFLLTAFLGYAVEPGIGATSLVATSPQMGFCDAEFLQEDGEWLLSLMAARTPTFKLGTAPQP